VTDEIQSRHLRVTHEGAHAAVGHLLGHKIKEIDCDRPDDGVDGWVQWEKPDWPLVEMYRRARERAIVLRAGALSTRMSWADDPLCESDRNGVRKFAEQLDVPLEAFEADITHEARKILDGSDFNAAHRALCRYLAEHIREVLPGERAHQIMDDALRVAAST
jgi:hypothetical protein